MHLFSLECYAGQRAECPPLVIVQTDLAEPKFGHRAKYIVWTGVTSAMVQEMKILQSIGGFRLAFGGCDTSLAETFNVLTHQKIRQRGHDTRELLLSSMDVDVTFTIGIPCASCPVEKAM